MKGAVVKRKTNETEIACSLNLGGNETAVRVGTGVGFLDHMLELLAFNACFGLNLKAKGDLRVDEHHTVEDCGIALGIAFKKALGTRAGIRRYGFFVLPMDEALAQCAVDLGGRPFCKIDLQLKAARLGGMDAGLLEDFLIAFANSSGAAIHLNVCYGRNGHHQAEAAFKALGRALRMACEKDEKRAGALPSTKGKI